MLRKHFSWLVITLFFMGGQVGCWGGGKVFSNPQMDSEEPDSEVEQTLHSLKRLSVDGPLYEMHFVGDYGFLERIQQRGALSRPPVHFACSCFAALGDPDSRIFGRNFDWYDHPALVLFTDPPDGFASISMVDISYLGYDGKKDPLKDPNNLLEAPFLPFDGMNEQGLAVGMMAIPHAEGGNDPNKITLDELELIRLLLDQASNVDEALNLMGEYNIDFGSVPVHYLVADSKGNSALVEYLNGKPVVQESDLPWQVSTNFLVAEEQPQGADSSCWRYNRLSLGLQEAGGIVDTQKGMDFLMRVAQDGEFATRWSWIFDLSQRRATLAFARDYRYVFEFSLKD